MYAGAIQSSSYMKLESGCARSEAGDSTDCVGEKLFKFERPGLSDCITCIVGISYDYWLRMVGSSGERDIDAILYL